MHAFSFGTVACFGSQLPGEPEVSVAQNKLLLLLSLFCLLLLFLSITITIITTTNITTTTTTTRVSKPTVYMLRNCHSMVVDTLLTERRRCPNQEGVHLYKGNQGK